MRPVITQSSARATVAKATHQYWLFLKCLSREQSEFGYNENGLVNNNSRCSVGGVCVAPVGSNGILMNVSVDE